MNNVLEGCKRYCDDYCPLQVPDSVQICNMKKTSVELDSLILGYGGVMVNKNTGRNRDF